MSESPVVLQMAPDGGRWLLQSAADVPAGDDWLTAVERARLAQLRVAKRRADWRLGRWTAKRAVSAALDVAADRVAIIAAAGGAPLALVDGVPAPLAISLSHAAGRGLCALAAPPTAVGCDLELVAPRAPAFAADYLTAAERDWSAGDARRLTLLWCAKEAILKAIGEGLREDPRSVAVTPAAEAQGTWRRLRITYGGQLVTGWARDLDDLVAVLAFLPGRSPRSCPVPEVR